MLHNVMLAIRVLHNVMLAIRVLHNVMLCYDRRYVCYIM